MKILDIYFFIYILHNNTDCRYIVNKDYNRKWHKRKYFSSNCVMACGGLHLARCLIKQQMSCMFLVVIFLVMVHMPSPFWICSVDVRTAEVCCLYIWLLYLLLESALWGNGSIEFDETYSVWLLKIRIRLWVVFYLL